VSRQQSKSQGLKRKVALRRDTEKSRAFQQRGRAPLSKGETFTGREANRIVQGGPPSATPKKPRRKRRRESLPGRKGWTKRVFTLYGRWCLACPPKNQERAVQAHHVIPLSTILDASHLSEKERAERAYDARNGMPVCKRCHERHETATKRIPLGKLLPQHLEWADDNGFTYYIERGRIYV
jgi:hypothetical protein